MQLELDGRCAAIAAGTRGLGYATANALADEGVRVAICGRLPDGVAAAASKIGRGAVGIVADVSSPAGATRFVEEAGTALGHIDILVCNAGGPPPGGPLATSVEAYVYALHLNLLSAIAMCSAVVPDMRSRKWGRVVAITSHAVREPSPGIAASSTARAAVTAYLKVLAAEVGPDGVTVNAVQPGAHDTDRLRDLGVDVEKMARSNPTRHLGSPEAFGRIVAFLCSAHARFVHGTSVLVDGGAYGGLI